MDASTTFQNIPPDKQRRVLDEAQREFAGHGFQGASMNRLATRLGIAKGSIFKYFGSKEGLFAAVFSGAVELLSGSLRQARDQTAGQPLAARLEQLLLVGADFATRHPDVYRIYLKMRFNQDFPMRQAVLGQVQAMSARFLTAILEQAKASGEVPRDLDPALGVVLIDAALDRYIQVRADAVSGRDAPGQDAPDGAADLAAMLARALTRADDTTLSGGSTHG